MGSFFHRAVCTFGIALWFASLPAMGQLGAKCKVLDPELQTTYTGGCKDGLAEGHGEATGRAQYKGAFKAGRKHGKGAKTWPSGDRYQGDFVEDRKEGVGTYTWGPRSPWAGEKYSGGYLNDRRHGSGVYEWPSGDRYAGPWENDMITGPATPMMMARARAQMEREAVVAKPGAKVCRELPVGIAQRDRIQGVVTEVNGGTIGVKIEDAGRFLQTLNGEKIVRGAVVRDAAAAWNPCR